MVTKVNGNSTSTFGGNVDVTGNVITDAPAFTAYLGTTQSISSAIFTKLQIDTKEFDTTNDYDNTTNYRYTPSVEGYYLVTMTGYLATMADAKSALSSIYKNGGEIQRGVQTVQGATGDHTSNATTLVYMNGSTDYLEFYVWQFNGNSRNATGQRRLNNASAVLVRAV